LSFPEISDAYSHRGAAITLAVRGAPRNRDGQERNVGTRSDLVHDVIVKSLAAGGSSRTQGARVENFGGYIAFLATIGMLRRKIADLEEWTLHAYSTWMQVEGFATGHMCNVLSCIRVIFLEVGRDLSVSSSNRNLGIPCRDRRGTHRSLQPEEHKDLIERASKVHKGFGAGLDVQYHFGLRMQELVRCVPDIPQWLADLHDGKSTLRVSRGTKNNRERDVEVPARRRKQAIAALEAAYEYCCENGGRLISGRNDDQKCAMYRFKYLCAKVGMVGKIANHCLRYSYLQNLVIELADSGIAPAEIAARACASLGHGVNRFELLTTVYCQPLAHLFKGHLGRPDNKHREHSPSRSRRARHDARRRRLAARARENPRFAPIPSLPGTRATRPGWVSSHKIRPPVTGFVQSATPSVPVVPGPAATGSHGQTGTCNIHPANSH
jgi:hypothetical protein